MNMNNRERETKNYYSILWPKYSWNDDDIPMYVHTHWHSHTHGLVKHNATIITMTFVEAFNTKTQPTTSTCIQWEGGERNRQKK